MSVQQISDLNLSMQNVMPAQVYSPIVPQSLPDEKIDEKKHEIETKPVPEPARETSRDGSSNHYGNVDTYA
jgi:hypothetical protein